jgi:hypothetical protein
MIVVRAALPPRRFIAALALPLIGTSLSHPAAAQSGVDTLRQEMQQMRATYDALLDQMRRDYEARMADMEKRLKAAESAATTATDKAATAQTTAEQATKTPSPTNVSTGGGANAFNPAIGVVLDGKFTSYGKDPDTYRIKGFALGDEAGLDRRGFGIGESEITFSSNIDQWLYGNLVVSIDSDGEVNVEEGFLQTTALPYGFTVKAGRFFSGIGYLNEQHAHTWDFADAPLPYRAFLDKQFGDDGVQLRWLAPTDFFLEFGTEGFRGDSFPAGNAANRGVGAYSAFFHVGDDIGDSHSFRTGLSWLHTKASNRETTSEFGTDVFSGDSNTLIFDAVYKWAPNGNPVDTNFKLQGEVFWRNEDGQFNGLDYDSGAQWGWYLQGVYQFMPRWRVGLRHDEVKAKLPSDAFIGTVLDPEGARPKRNSAMIDYSTSEFGRFRLQYNRDESRPTLDNQFILQYTVSLGAHGAHSY